MDNVTTMMKDGWMEETSSSKANVTIGTLKLLGGATITWLATQKMPALGLTTGVALSVLELFDFAYAMSANKIPEEHQSLVANVDNGTLAGKARIRSLQRGVQFATAAGLLKAIGLALYTRNGGLFWTSAKVLGGAAGLVNALASSVLVGSITAGVQVYPSGRSIEFTGREKLGSFLGVWHPEPPPQEV